MLVYVRLAYWLWAAAQALSPSAPLALTQSVRAELLEGRASLTVAQARVEWLVGKGFEPMREDAELELGALARARVSFLEHGSWHIHGPAQVAWRKAPPQGESAAAVHGQWVWTFQSVAKAAVEVRRGPVRLEFPGGAWMEVQLCALAIRDLGAGKLEIVHQAGLPALVQLPPTYAGPRPCQSLLAGGKLELDVHPLPIQGAIAGALVGVWLEPDYVPPKPRPDATARARAWRSFAWPFASLNSGSFQSGPSGRSGQSGAGIQVGPPSVEHPAQLTSDQAHGDLDHARVAELIERDQAGRARRIQLRAQALQPAVDWESSWLLETNPLGDQASEPSRLEPTFELLSQPPTTQPQAEQAPVEPSVEPSVEPIPAPQEQHGMPQLDQRMFQRPGQPSRRIVTPWGVSWTEGV